MENQIPVSGSQFSAVIVIVMGVEGSGKTTVGALLAQELGWEFADADSFHSPENIEKIRRGIPLNDADRAPWIEAMRKAIVRWIGDRRNAVLACSALKRAYRERLWVGPEVKLVYLKGTFELIAQRLKARHGHFAGEQILTSQFADLEEPQDEAAVTVDVSHTPEQLVAEIETQLKLA
ncbi:MAG TPA: gluconokinase [Terriglobales bacterium]|nr:gluconokinase [Terriglobales bacterium]